MPPVNIDLNNVLDIALRGVRRAVAFMGLGVNAATDPDFKKVHLDDSETNFRLLPEKLSEEAIAEIKANFRVWIEAGGFRELCESFEAFLIEVYRVAALLNASEGGVLSAGVAVDVPGSFERAGLGEKLDVLARDFGIAPEHPEFLKSFWQARNCLVHRRGVVGPKDLSGGRESLDVRWIGFDVFIVDDRNIEIPLHPGFEPFQTVGEGKVYTRVAERQRSFRLGEVLSLSAHELAEICFNFQRSAGQLHDALVSLGQAKGVPFVAKRAPEDGAMSGAEGEASKVKPGADSADGY